jgi:hypothetical protein
MSFSQSDETANAISSIPAVLISAAIAIYYSFWRLPTLYAQGLGFNAVLWDMIPYVILPGLTLAPLSFCIAYEIIWRINENTSLQLQVRRFMGRVLIQLIGIGVFTAAYLFSLNFLLPATSPSIALALTAIIWSLAFYAIMRKGRKTLGRFGIARSPE